MACTAFLKCKPDTLGWLLGVTCLVVLGLCEENNFGEAARTTWRGDQGTVSASRAKSKALFLADPGVASGRSISLSADWLYESVDVQGPARSPLPTDPSPPWLTSEKRMAGQSRSGPNHVPPTSNRELGNASQERKPTDVASSNRPLHRLRSPAPPGPFGWSQGDERRGGLPRRAHMKPTEPKENYAPLGLVFIYLQLISPENRTLRESQAEATKAHLALHIRM